MALIVAHRTTGLMMHQKFYSLAVCIFIECLDIKIRIRSYEIEDIILLMTKPIFPTDIPSFDEYLVETIRCSEIYIFSHILIVGTMLAVWLYLGIVNGIELYRREIPCV